jgi:hypothetical protein
MDAESILKASPISATPLAFRTLVLGFNDVEDGFEEP